jgi:Flp pilus assembly pilin Flp
MGKLFRQFWSCDRGSALTEYALIIALVALGLVGALAVFRNSVGNVANNSAVTISQKTGGGYGTGGGWAPSQGYGSPAPVNPAEPDSSGGDSTAVAAASRVSTGED